MDCQIGDGLSDWYWIGIFVMDWLIGNGLVVW